MFRLPNFLRREDRNNCGILALESMAKYYGFSTTYKEIKGLVFIDKLGINLLSLLNAAESIGFSAKGMKGSYDAIGSIPLPAIAHMATVGEPLNHFVVLHKWDNNAVVVSDRNKGVRRQSRVEFCSYWTGYLLVVKPKRNQ
ncbi:MAG: cysteine peptidase family C39 domain-containing protein [Psychroserpens sp.]|uniref:cysteine peptidase family C39 domain-containing protein n=1 Tax=Psychroserpens sp. TaxID=2020870 RepID=UPI0030032DD8